MTSRPRRFLLAACALAATLASYPAVVGADDEQQERGITLLSPPDRAQIRYGDREDAVTTFAWRDPSAAGAYRLVLARDSAFDRVVVNRRVTANSIGVRGLAEGTYYWHVQALDDDDAPLFISPRATFSIAGAESP